MSNQQNQIILTWIDAENFITPRTPKMYDAKTELTPQARSIVRDAVMLWYLATWDTLLSFGVHFDKSSSNRWLTAIGETQITEMVDMLKEVSHLLVSKKFTSYDAFKQHLSLSYPCAGAILAPVRKIIHHWYLTSDTDALNLCYSWTLFIGRLNLPGLSVLAKDALEKYLVIEDQIKEDDFTPQEKDLITRWFPRTLEEREFLKKNFSPSHGPGATSDAGRVLQNKYALLGTNQRLRMLLQYVYADEDPYPRPPVNLPESLSKTIFVPKTLGSYRTISMETASNMWHQKGIHFALQRLISKRKRAISRRYVPEVQQDNRDLAQEGSRDGSFATIDLSSASDTVSWNLVKTWFGDTSLYPWLLWTRSTHTLLPNGEVIKLKKFAPMGSDLCFPIEVLTFIAITECSIRECGDDPRSSRFKVFGDDIVVEEKYVDAVKQRLIRNGFIINNDKTFSGSQPMGFFRESCGGFFFNGVDITPVRLSRRFSGYSGLGADTSGRIESLIQLANDCFDRYPSVRSWCVKELKTLPPWLSVPFSESGDIGLKSLQPTNFHLRVTESRPLQTLVYTYGANQSLKAKVVKEVENDPTTMADYWEDIRFYEYLRRVNRRTRLIWPEDRMDVSVAPTNLTLWLTTKGSLY